MALFSKLFVMPPEIQHEFEDLLDIYSLLALGGTCLHFRNRVSWTLKHERNAIIRQYWPDPEAFLRILTSSRAVITGEAALAFVMRDRSLLTDELEVCVSGLYAHVLVSTFEGDPHVNHAWSDDEWPTYNNKGPTVFLYKSPSDDLIRVISSHTHSPFTPLSYYPTTALFNYMDEFSFGSAYRHLTLNRRGVVPDRRYLAVDAIARVNRITDRGVFQQSEWPAAVAFPPGPFALHDAHAAWNDPNLEPHLVNSICLRSRFQCPGQARFFGDAGSLVDFFEPDMVDHAIMARWNYAPYGSTAVWRMEGQDCDYNCAMGDYLLPDGLYNTCSVGQSVYYGPFTTGVMGDVTLGESQHRRICQSTVHDIKRQVRSPYEIQTHDATL